MSGTLVTGASGFVGEHLLKMSGMQPLLPAQIDVKNIDALESWFRLAEPDAVIHLAAQSNVPSSFKAPHDTYEVNFLGTLNVLTALERIGFDGVFLFVGTGDTYGTVASQDLPVVESQTLRPRSPYAVSKVAAEALCYQWSQTCQFKLVMTRSFNHIGPGQSANFAIGNFAQQIAKISLGLQSAQIKHGDLSATRDFTDVRDVTKAYASLLSNGTNGEIYNVCSSVERSLHSVLLQMGEISGVKFDLDIDSSLVRGSEQNRAVGNFDKLHAATGWRPLISFEKSLEDIIDYWIKATK